MPRLLSTLLVLALLGGTAAAFAVTEGLKLEKSPIFAPRIDKTFSPVCECDTSLARIAFRLRKADDATVTIVDSGGDLVRTLAESTPYKKRRWARLVWDGRNDDGRVVPEGLYRARVHLDREHRTIVIPNKIRVDTTPPRVKLVSVRPRVFSPDRDFRHDRITVRYRVNEPAHVALFVDGSRRARPRGQPLTGEIRWFGRHGGRAYGAGIYRVSLRATDLAGNVSRRSRSVHLRVRYIELSRERIRVKAGTRFGVQVSTDSKAYRWRLGKRRGIATKHFLVLRAPDKAGRYKLVVSEHGHKARAVIVVRPPT